MNKQAAFGPASPAPHPWNGHEIGDGWLSGDPRLELSDESLDDASRNAFPVVAQQRSRKDGLGILAGIGVALVLGFATFMSLNTTREAKAPVTAQTSIAPAKAEPTITAPTVARAPMEMPAVAQTAPRADAAPSAGMMHGTQALPTSPVVVFDGSIAPGASTLSGPRAQGEGSGMLSSATNSQTGANSADTARSTPMADPSMTVVQGTLISAVLETAINSDVPGYARAVVSQDVRSFDGSRILIPRSSRLIGEYKAMSSAGQRRVHLIWTRLVRPDGVSIQLASPATDSSGRAGVGGKVNSHFFGRLGSALLSSVIGAANPFSRGATVVVAGGETAASGVLQNGQRPATVKVSQGEPVRVFAARDLVFTPTDAPAE